MFDELLIKYIAVLCKKNFFTGRIPERSRKVKLQAFNYGETGDECNTQQM